MESIKSLVKKLDYTKLIIITLVVMVFFGTFLRMNYTTDTYAVFEGDPSGIISNFLASGRYVTALCFILFRLIGLPHIVSYRVSIIAAYISMILAIYLLDSLYKKIKIFKDDKTRLLVAIITLINPFSIELFLYIEKGVMVGSLLLCVVAAIYFERFVSSKNKKDIALSVLFGFLAASSYQGTLGLFVVLANIIIVSKKLELKDFIIDTAWSVFVYAVSAALNLITIRIFFGNGRASGAINIVESIGKIKLGTVEMLKMYGVIPAYLMPLLIIALLVIMLIVDYRKNNINIFVKNLVRFAWLSLIVVLASVAPQALQNTNSIWMVCRSTYIFASIFAVCCAIFGIRNKNTGAELSITILCLILIVFQVYNFNKITSDHYALNAIDGIRARGIIKEIDDYEVSSNKNVVKFYAAQDKNRQPAYNGIFTSGDINSSAFFTPWSDMEIIELYSGRKLERALDVSDIDLGWCRDNDYSELDGQQVRFYDDMIVICEF